MTKRQAKLLTKRIEELMAKKSRLLTQAQAFSDMGLEETARPVWSTAASYEERIAPLLDAIGPEAEAAVHRISAASCFEKSGDSSRAANLYRAALAGPLSDAARADVERMLSACLEHLHQAVVDSVGWIMIGTPGTPHKSVHRPSRKSRRASSPKASRRPSTTSRSN